MHSSKTHNKHYYRYYFFEQYDNTGMVTISKSCTEHVGRSSLRKDPGHTELSSRSSLPEDGRRPQPSCTSRTPAASLGGHLPREGTAPRINRWWGLADWLADQQRLMICCMIGWSAVLGCWLRGWLVSVVRCGYCWLARWVEWTSFTSLNLPHKTLFYTRPGSTETSSVMLIIS